MDLYGDLPPAEGTEGSSEPMISQGGWARRGNPVNPMRPQQIQSAKTSISINLNVSGANNISSSNSSAVNNISSISTNNSFGAPSATQASGKFLPAALQMKPRAPKINNANSLNIAPTTTTNQAISSTGRVGISLSLPTVVSSQTVLSLQTVSSEDGNIDSSSSGSEAVMISFDVADPYDPMKPNDYLQWCEERLEIKRVARLEEENKIKLVEMAQERNERERERIEAAEKGDINKLTTLMNAGRGRGRGVSNLPAWMVQQISSSSDSSGIDNNSTGTGSRPGTYVDGQFEDVNQNNNGRGSSHLSNAGNGSRIMNNLGHKDGDGLGRQGNEGIREPIEMNRTGQGRGVIVNNDNNDNNNNNNVAQASANSSQYPHGNSLSFKRKAAGSLFSNPTCVLLLKNMVALDEVDNLLGLETKSECEKYGPVRDCKVFTITRPGVASEEQVRTFVAFERQESAIKACRDMNGRFFGGRQIAASFYDEEQFRRGHFDDQ